jgi:mannose-6-phosphate isomerase-like protein (cupin superfamily)
MWITYSYPRGPPWGLFPSRDMSEIYYVMAGDGSVTIGSETAQIHSGDAVPVRLGERQSFANSGSGPLEFIVFGIASDMAAEQALMETKRRLR